MAYYPKPTPPNRSTRKPSGKAKPAFKRYPSKEDASGRMSQPKPSGKRVKPFKPGDKGGVGATVPKPAKYTGPRPTRTAPSKGGQKKLMPTKPESKKGLRDIATDAFRAATYFPYGMIADAMKPSKPKAVANFGKKYARKRKK